MIAVVDYHKGNLKSVERSIAATGADVFVTDNPEIIALADAIVLPGVGAFADAASTMRQLGQIDIISQRIREGVPFLGICLGLHLMFEAGEEGKTSAENGEFWRPHGMGVLPGIVRKLPKKDEQGASYKIPHVGWNSIQFEKSPLFEGIPRGEYFYFTHSYAVPEGSFAIAHTTHSATFPCAVRYGDVAYGVQFHPEKSSNAGMQLLCNFVNIAKG